MPVSSRYATPAVWTHEATQYLLVATVKGELRLIDPQSGKVLWTVEGLQPTYYSLSPSQKHVFVNVRSAFNEPANKGGRMWGRIGAYRITPQKAEPAWQAPDKPPFWFENHMDICAMRRLAVRDGRVYLFTQGHSLDPASSATHFNILDENTGEVLLTSTQLKGSPLFYLVEDRMLYTPDSAHWKAVQWQFWTLDPKGFRPLGELWKVPHDNTTAYEVFIELPYANGRFYMRTWQGQVVCYDFRAAN
jgi:outer membrane protein assembly factor BamB